MGINLKKRFWVKIAAIVLLVFAIFGSEYKDNKAKTIAKIVDREIYLTIDENKEIPLAKIGDTDWQYICPITFEATGIDVSRALKTAASYLKVDERFFNDYSIVDEIYTEFEGSRNGLILISTSEKIFVSLYINNVWNIKGNECLGAKSAYLKTEKTKQGLIASLRSQ